MTSISNPISFNPDPSCIYVNDTYFLVCSSFLYWPGIPVYTSKDLKTWTQIGNVINRREQLDYSGCRLRPGTTNCGGIWAPTIRYHEGVFYVVTTNVFPHKDYTDYSRWQNVIFSTTDPLSNNWSDPVYFEYPGYDTSLFWDTDGKAYVQGSFYWRIRYEISQFEIDLKTGKSLSGEPRALWPGTGGMAPEAPHMYKKDGCYYLMIAEGGTEFGHCVTIARAPTVWGPFESNPSNPIAHAASRDSLFQTVGHADLFPDAAGNWHAVLLASRMVEGRFPIGRESTMVNVDWSGDWPVFDLSALEAPARVALPVPDGSTAGSWEDVLAGPTHALLHLRVPETDSHQIITKANGLPAKRVIRANSVPLTAPLGSPAFLGVRQRHIYFETEIELALPTNAPENFTAGYAAYLDHERHFAITINNRRACLVSVKPGAEPQNIGEGVDLLNDVTTVRLRIIGTPTKYYFDIISDTKNEWLRLGEGDTGIVSAGFTGVVLAVFAVSEVDKAPSNQVEVLGWRYRPTA